MADIFVSYTKSDSDPAQWIGKELEALGHTPYIHEWEIEGGENIYGWMETRIDAAHHMLCVVSEEYLKAPYSTLERRAGLWVAAKEQPGFVLLVQVKPCRLPRLSANISHCNLVGKPREIASREFRKFISERKPPETVNDPFRDVYAATNISIRVPPHFMGRDDELAAIEAGLGRHEGRVAITALRGLRGVGKTVLAAAYAERHRTDYRATWWIGAQTERTIRADLVALGKRLDWVARDEKEEPALAAVTERLRHEGDDILLIFDNAVDVNALWPYLPPGGAARVLITSNYHDWLGIGQQVEIAVWPSDVGARFLLARIGREAEREAAELLSQALGGLPLAHEQAGAYCSRLGTSIAEYHRRFIAAPVQMLDIAKDAPLDYHPEYLVEHKDRLTLAKTFALAINEAAKLHPAAEPLIVHAALLAPEPIPLFLFAETREKFCEPLASALAGDGLDEAVAALRAFALVDREPIPDERDPATSTDTIRLHSLVREIAEARWFPPSLPLSRWQRMVPSFYNRLARDRRRYARENARRALIEAVDAVYPGTPLNDPISWPRARRLNGIAFALVGGDAVLPNGTETVGSHLMNQLAEYHHAALGAYARARALSERALTISETTLGDEHPNTAARVYDLAALLKRSGDLDAARPLYERSLAFREKTLGREHPDTAECLLDLAELLQYQEDYTTARPLIERARAIYGKARPEENQTSPEHKFSLLSGWMRASVLPFREQLDLVRKDPQQAEAIVSDLPTSGPGFDFLKPAFDYLNKLGELGNLFADLWAPAAERPSFEEWVKKNERTLKRLQIDLGLVRQIFESFDREINVDPQTATLLNNIAALAAHQDNVGASRSLMERVLAGQEKILDPNHPDIATRLSNIAYLLHAEGDLAEARSRFERALAIREKSLGPDHPDTAASLQDLASILQAQGDFAAAQPRFERALAIREKSLGPDHPDTAASLHALASILQVQGDLAAAQPRFERVLAIRENSLGPDHPDTAASLKNLADLLQTQDNLAAARPLLERVQASCEKALGPDHPYTAASLRNLAGLLQAQGDLVTARPLFERALAIREKSLGPDHPDTAASLQDLASILQVQGDLAAAQPRFERALAIREKSLGPDHPDTAASLQDLASILQVQGDLAAAQPRFERALAIREKSLGPDHPDTAASLHDLASILQVQGDLAAAQPRFERALAIREKSLGLDHPDTAASLHDLASVLQAQGDLAAARPLFERALAIYEKALGPEHSYTATSLGRLARLLQDQGELAAARPLFERALAIDEKALGPDHPNTAASHNNLAQLLQDQGDFAAARTVYERALAICEMVFGPDHPNTAIVRNNLASVVRSSLS